MLYATKMFHNSIRFLVPFFVILSAGASASPSIQGNLAWDSEYVDRGVRQSGSVLQPGIDLYAGKYYVGAAAFLEVDADFEEINLYGGTYRPLSPLLSLDLGLNLIQVDGTGDAEAYAGLVLEFGLNPAIYAFYEWEAETLSIEAALGSRIDLHPKLFLDWSLTAGGSLPEASDSSSWAFVQGTLDLVYPLTNRVELSLGLRASSRDEDLNLPDSSHLWTGIGLRFDL